LFRTPLVTCSGWTAWLISLALTSLSIRATSSHPTFLQITIVDLHSSAGEEHSGLFIRDRNEWGSHCNNMLLPPSSCHHQVWPWKGEVSAVLVSVNVSSHCNRWHKQTIKILTLK
jgi:hypothetical protein